MLHGGFRLSFAPGASSFVISAVQLLKNSPDRPTQSEKFEKKHPEKTRKCTVENRIMARCRQARSKV